jgi:hypothetical protein
VTLVVFFFKVAVVIMRAPEPSTILVSPFGNVRVRESTVVNVLVVLVMLIIFDLSAVFAVVTVSDTSLVVTEVDDRPVVSTLSVVLVRGEPPF